MNLYYSLNKQIPSEKIIRDLVNMVQKFQASGGDLSNSILRCEIVNIQDHSGDSPIPKLEHYCPT